MLEVVRTCVFNLLEFFFFFFNHYLFTSSVTFAGYVRHNVYLSFHRKTHGGVQWDAVTGGDASGLQNSEGIQSKLCHPAVHQLLSPGDRKCPPQGHTGEKEAVARQQVYKPLQDVTCHHLVATLAASSSLFMFQISYTRLHQAYFSFRF